MIESSKALRILSFVFLASMLLTVAFIFVNSMLPPEISSEQSDIIGDIIAEIIPPETNAGSFIQQYLRKIAHFTEYGLLGVETMLFIFTAHFLLGKLKRSLVITLGALLPVFVGFADETIQLFSDRGPSILDVWIDIGGYYTFSLLTASVLALATLACRLFARGRSKANN